jgi:hypothetical protein
MRDPCRAWRMTGASRLLLGLLLSAPARAGDCPMPVSLVTLDGALGRAEVAIGALDLDALRLAITESDTSMACLAEPATTVQVARWFRVHGIYQFAVGDEAAAAQSFTAARALQAAYKLDPTLGAPVRAAWEAANPPPESWTVELPVPAEGWLQVDGRRSDTAPQGRAYVLQWFGADGAVRLTRVVQANEVPPAYPVAAAGPPRVPSGPGPTVVGTGALPPAPIPPAQGRSGHPSRALAVGGVAAVVAGGAAIAASAALKGSFEDSTEPSGEIQSTILANRALGYGGPALVVAGAGLGIGAVVSGRW